MVGFQQPADVAVVMHDAVVDLAVIFRFDVEHGVTRVEVEVRDGHEMGLDAFVAASRMSRERMRAVMSNDSLGLRLLSAKERDWNKQSRMFFSLSPSVFSMPTASERMSEVDFLRLAEVMPKASLTRCRKSISPWLTMPSHCTRSESTFESAVLWFSLNFMYLQFFILGCNLATSLRFHEGLYFCRVFYNAKIEKSVRLIKPTTKR